MTQEQQALVDSKLYTRKTKSEATFAASDGSALPSRCEKHPTAMVRHSWNESHYILNGLPSGEGIKSEHAYECAECGRPLAEPNADVSDRRYNPKR